MFQEPDEGLIKRISGYFQECPNISDHLFNISLLTNNVIKEIKILLDDNESLENKLHAKSKALKNKAPYGPNKTLSSEDREFLDSLIEKLSLTHIHPKTISSLFSFAANLFNEHSSSLSPSSKKANGKKTAGKGKKDAKKNKKKDDSDDEELLDEEDEEKELEDDDDDPDKSSSDLPVPIPVDEYLPSQINSIFKFLIVCFYFSLLLPISLLLSCSSFLSPSPSSSSSFPLLFFFHPSLLFSLSFPFPFPLSLSLF